jgi:hypothetical protein
MMLLHSQPTVERSIEERVSNCHVSALSSGDEYEGIRFL